MFPICPINSVLVFNQMWPEIKVPKRINLWSDTRSKTIGVSRTAEEASLVSKMPRATKNSAHVMNTSVSQESNVS